MLFARPRSDKRKRKPSRQWIGRTGLEILEGRQVPASLVSPWPDPQHLTISFAPDGTGIGRQTNALTQTLDTEFGTTDPKVWQRVILRAAQTWASVTNVNFGVVADGGQAFGAAGAPEGDSRFGDIRVGAAPQSAGTLALTQPPSLVAGTWAGDVTLNSSATFGDGTNADLYTVALHEFGHSLGLDDNTADPTSVMYGEYTGPRTALSAADVSAIQALYGARQADAFEGPQGNETLKAAPKISYDGNFTSTQVQTLSADVTTHSDQDNFYFTVPRNETAVNVRVQTSGISLLEGQLTVYDTSGNPVGTATATDPLSGDLVVHLANLKFNACYYVRVQGASPDAFGIGGYNLQLDYRATAPTLLGPLTQAVNYIVASTSPDNTINSALGLQQKPSAADPRFQYSVKDSIALPTQGHMYWITHPSAASGVMTVTAWGLESGGLQPMITVYDTHNNRVAATVLFNENGTYTVQIPNANASGYTIAVKAEDTIAHSLGNYFLGIDFGNPATTLNALGGGQVAPSSNGVDVPITAPHDDLFHFTLTGSAASSTTSAVQLTLYDALGNAVATLAAGAQQTTSLTVFLAAGTYTARFSYVGGGLLGGSTVPLNYTFLGADLSDPIKVYGSSGGGSTPPTH